MAEYFMNIMKRQDDFMANLVLMTGRFPLTLIICIVTEGVDYLCTVSSRCFFGIERQLEIGRTAVNSFRVGDFRTPTVLPMPVPGR